ncbi:MAG: Bax inhibitor-1 family protein [Bacilli bacterium]
METFTPESDFDKKPIKKNGLFGKEKKTYDNSALLSMGMIFLWFAIGLAVAGSVALGLPYLLNSPVFGGDVEAASTAYVGMMIGAIVVLLVSNLVITFSQGRKNGIVTGIFYILYAIAIGVLLSSVLMTVFTTSAALGDDTMAISVISISFFVSAGCFLVMGIIGMLFKNMNAAIPVVITGFLGVIIISIVNFFLQSEMIFWIVEFVLFALILLATSIDIHNIVQISSRSECKSSSALSIYCAFILFTDFINIFIRVLYFVMILFGKSKN